MVIVIIVHAVMMSSFAKFWFVLFLLVWLLLFHRVWLLVLSCFGSHCCLTNLKSQEHRVFWSLFCGHCSNVSLEVFVGHPRHCALGIHLKTSVHVSGPKSRTPNKCWRGHQIEPDHLVSKSRAPYTKQLTYNEKKKGCNPTLESVEDAHQTSSTFNSNFKTLCDQ